MLHSNIKDVFHDFFMLADVQSPNRCHWQKAKVKNYNLNVTEALASDSKMLFPGIFILTVGILFQKLVKYHGQFVKRQKLSLKIKFECVGVFWSTIEYLCILDLSRKFYFQNISDSRACDIQSPDLWLYGGFKILVQKVFEGDLSCDGICKKSKFQCIFEPSHFLSFSVERDHYDS